MSESKEAQKPVDVAAEMEKLQKLLPEAGALSFDIKYLEAKQIQIHQAILECKQRIANAPKLSGQEPSPDTSHPSDASSASS